ncbi:MAG: hypoxanthine phosphoribosyltransferase [Thermodesulfobacteriota bacterium]|nr:hypoxanthine phosphoribosyltransferase [Thermodesulfobacteriota bacterium]
MKKKMILSRQEIQARVRELGRTISRDYQGGKLVMIGVLNGAFIFMADLARAIDLQLEVDFIRVASYGQSDSSSGKISLSKDVEMDLAGKDVLLVEDIIDTGRTLAYLKDYFSRHRAASVKICALIDKKERREVEIEADYVGFDVVEGFLVGYGLDFAEQYRQFPDVYHLENPES